MQKDPGSSVWLWVKAQLRFFKDVHRTFMYVCIVCLVGCIGIIFVHSMKLCGLIMHWTVPLFSFKLSHRVGCVGHVANPAGESQGPALWSCLNKFMDPWTIRRIRGWMSIKSGILKHIFKYGATKGLQIWSCSTSTCWNLLIVCFSQVKPVDFDIL